jgi:hypothetical protein
MAVIEETEKRLAVITNWAFFGSFGSSFILSGFSDGDLVMGQIGFAVLALGFIAHVIINRIFDAGFSKGEVAFGLIVFGVSVLSFVGSWLFDPHFGGVNIVIGLAGFSEIVACLIVYVVIKFGLKGSFTMIHQLRNH